MSSAAQGPAREPGRGRVERRLDPERAAVVLVAAGASTRMRGEVRKPLLPLAGLPLVEHSALALDRAERVTEIVLVAHPDDVETFERWCAERPSFAKVAAVVAGGATRTDSVRRGVFWCAFSLGVIGVHDAARPLVDPRRVDRAVAAAARHGAALLAVPVTDTIKRSADGRRVQETLDRGGLWSAQTPQCFAARPFREYVARAAAEGFAPTDDAALWERYAGGVALVEGDPANFKVTTPFDLELAHAVLERRGASAAATPERTP